MVNLITNDTAFGRVARIFIVLVVLFVVATIYFWANPSTQSDPPSGPSEMTITVPGTVVPETFDASETSTPMITNEATGSSSLPTFSATGSLIINTAPSSNPSSPPLWGAHVGWEEGKLEEFERRIGQAVDIEATFVHWGNESEFPSAKARTLSAQGKTLLIFWEAMDYNSDPVRQPRFNYDGVLNGDFDRYFKDFAATAALAGLPVILIPFEEMNGNWYPWSGTVNNNSPDKHRAAYRYVHGFFKDAPNLRFGWAPNAVSVPDVAGNKIEDYYPGDEYVDVVGLNGFNDGEPWIDFTDIFGKGLSILSPYGKPIYIFSMAAAEDPRKPAWISDTITTIKMTSGLAGWVWFNEDKEKDWRVWSSEASLEAFQKAVAEE